MYLCNCLMFLLFSLSKQEIFAKLTFHKGPPSLEVELEKLRDIELAECPLLLRNSPSILVQFHSGWTCTEAASYIWECNKEITGDKLLINLPTSFPALLKLDGEYFSITFQFSDVLLIWPNAMLLLNALRIVN